jgi:hypothetical protein
VAAERVASKDGAEYPATIRDEPAI